MFDHKDDNDERGAGERKSVQAPARLRRDGLSRRNIPLELDPLRRQLERPGEQQRQRQTEQQDDDEGLQDPVRGPEVLEGKFGHLRQQPAYHAVSGSDPNYVSPL